jgi:GDPmannose 4,6-dehydratase
MTKALITGITGMVGSHLADYLLANTDWNIYGMSRWRSPLDNISHLLNRINKNDRISLVNGDLCDPMSIREVIVFVQPDFVFHLAAQSDPKTSFTSPFKTLDVNILGTMRLLEEIRDAKIDPVIHVCSSSEVFGRVPKEKLPIDEECSFHPASPYALSKIGTDLLGRYYAEAYDMKVVTTRLFTHTGPRRGDVFAESSFAKQIVMIEKGLIPQVIRVGNLNSLRTWMDVRDAVRAYYMLVTKNPIPGEVYNIGGNYSCTIGDMLTTLLTISGMQGRISIEVDPGRIRPLDADLQIPNTKKFSAYTGWKPEIPFEKTMRDLLDYWRDKLSNGNQGLVR